MNSHPLIDLVLSFIHGASGFVRDELTLTANVFSFLIENVPDYKVNDELGKAVMRLQFPTADDTTLLQMWRVASTCDRRQQPSSVVSSVIELTRSARREAESAAQRANEERLAAQRRAEKLEARAELLSRSVTTLDLPKGVLSALQAEHICYLGQLVPMSESQLLEVPRIGGAALVKIHGALREHSLFLHTDVGEWTPPS
jgi:hypothetical protein